MSLILLLCISYAPNLIVEHPIKTYSQPVQNFNPTACLHTAPAVGSPKAPGHNLFIPPYLTSGTAFVFVESPSNQNKSLCEDPKLLDHWSRTTAGTSASSLV
ncbi:hypothetical protein AVEN_197538-1 [Araneus ventricosus]|uniref:Uncharacterized protein n=1 Tax=Araneus ventricosus TaxID=182803 RepID=A0A4Y2BRM3_ARAVE|nr:hypothetical protein AVEN_197538-1 [Araneus ventricosus]